MADSANLPAVPEAAPDMARGALAPAAPGYVPVPDRLQYAKALAQSGLLPQAYRDKPANVFYAVEYGNMLGIAPLAAITGIHIIEGKPTASAALMSALVRRAGHRLRVSVKRDAQGLPVATAQIVRSDDPEFVFEAVWTVARAQAAGLVGLKDGKPYSRSSSGKVLPWEAYTEAMLKARAISEVAREACEEALGGVHYTPEELGATVDEEGAVVVSSARVETPSGPPVFSRAELQKEAFASLAPTTLSTDEKWATVKRAWDLADLGEGQQFLQEHREALLNGLDADAETQAEARQEAGDEPVDAEVVPEPSESPSAAPAAPKGTPVLTVQTKRIHALQRSAGITELEYRVLLNRLFGVSSSKELTKDQASDIIEELESLVEKAGVLP